MATEYKLSYTASQIDAKLGKIDSLALKNELPTKTSELTNDSGFLTSIPSEYITENELNNKGYLTSYTETDPTVPAWAKATTKPSYTKSEVGLDNVDNVKQYSASNPPPYPVTSVNGKTGDVTISVPTKVSQLQNDSGFLTEISKEEIVQQVIAALGTPVFGRVDENNNIILTGELADGTYTVKYEDGEGNVTEIGTLNHAVVPEPAYTNLADPTSADWLVGYRMSSGGEIKAESVTHVSNYIPVKVGDVVRVRGQNLFFHGPGTGYATQTFYNANKERVAKLTYGQGMSEIYGTTHTPDDYEPVGDFVITVANGAEIVSGDASDIAYVRFSGRLWNGYTTDDVIITVNQEITE